MSLTDYEHLCVAYDARIDVQDSFTSSISVLCRTVLESNGIEIAALESRTKSSDSLREKVSRPEKAGKYNALDDITDLSGVRLILFLKDDCEKAVELISSHFLVDEKNSSNKSELMDPDRFGYLSSHLIISYGKDREGLFEFAPYKGLKAEVQIRTVLQHAWSAIDWRLRYKSKVEVPRPLRRKLYRISALLETADDEFALLDRQATEVRSEYSAKIKKGGGDVALDGDSIAAFFKEDSYWLKLSEKVRQILGTVKLIDPGKVAKRTEALFELLSLLKIESIGTIRDTLKSNESRALKEFERVARYYGMRGGGGLSQEATLRILLILSVDPAPLDLASTIGFPEMLRTPLIEVLESRT